MADNKYTPNPRKYYKTNFVDLVELITPKVYEQEDLALSGTELNPISQVINGHIRAAANPTTVLSISGVANTQTSSLETISGLSQYFVKQNNLTRINPFDLETKILLPLSTTLTNYDTSAEFQTYLSGTLLPMIIPSTQTRHGGPVTHIGTLSALTNSVAPSSVHNHLVDTLGWFYFLNTSADGGLDYSPSSYVLSSLGRVYLGETLETVDGVKGFAEYLWRNYATCSMFNTLELLPGDYVSGTADAITETSAGTLPTYTSGIQRLENLQTLIDIIYSPLFIDQQDYTVKDAFDDYIEAETLLADYKSKGPMRKFSNVMGFEFADITDQIENIGLIYDIENTKEEYLQYIAELIGWKLKGASPAKWRHQLRIAVDLYKKTGTLDAIQTAVNSLISNTVLDVSGKTSELWESYLPFLLWYALGTESPLFKDLNTWTPGLANEAGVFTYSTSSLEENIHMVVDTILLDLWKAFPDNFIFHGERFPVPQLWELDSQGNRTQRYTVVGEPNMKPFHAHIVGGPGYEYFRREAEKRGDEVVWNQSLSMGPLGSGVYMAGLEHPNYGLGEEPLYLQADGDMEFVFNYRNRTNFPLPPFTEVKYYRDSSVTADMVALIVEKLKCFKVKGSFADQVGDYLLSGAVNTTTALGDLNEWLMFFSSVQVPPNFDDVMLSISNYEKNLLNLWNGKSSHLFIDFAEGDFDFSKTTLEGDGKYALYEAARIAKEFVPAHTVPRTNLTASAMDDYYASGTPFSYAGIDKDDDRAYYASGSILGNAEFSGVRMGSVAPGSNDGRGGLNTFHRKDVDSPFDALVSSVLTVTDKSSVARRGLRRRNFRYTLPKEGYYDRTGFNGPVSYDPSVLENSMPSSMGELTLGYVASAGKFFPVIDPITPSGVWHECETLESSKTFSGVATSATFPFRGLHGLSSNTLMPEVGATTDRYVDRGQVPEIYITMHEMYEAKARDYANQQISNDPTPSAYVESEYWKDNIQSFANEAIASGLVLNSYDDYLNFKFGVGLHQLHRDYCKYFAKHDLSLADTDKTGGNIFAQVFGNGLYNCDFDLEGSAVTTDSTIINTVVSDASAIDSTNVWTADATGVANGTFIASGDNDAVIPLSGTFVSGNINNAEYRCPAILSGIEFTDTSGASTSNQFLVFKLDPSFAVPGIDNPLIQNTVIKAKSVGNGFPRIRFDLSAYGDRRNYFIKDHAFKLKLKALIAEENNTILGGGGIGVWIHTDPVENTLWSWTPKQKWEFHSVSSISKESVLNNFSHRFVIPEFEPPVADQEYCLNNTSVEMSSVVNTTLLNIKDSYFQNLELDFDTRNFTVFNNYEYLDIIPIKEDEYKINNQVNTDQTNYIVEIFFIPNNNTQKYMLLDTVELQDTTQRENAGIGTGHGIETSGVPNRRFVKEDKLYLNKDQLKDVLKFYNGLMGQGTGLYSTSLASRDATITSGIMEVSGGSRLNYRISPFWTPAFARQSGYSNTTNLELDN
jgi:hypothetical protein